METGSGKHLFGKSKAQAAMEFLLTYGWALIVVGVLIAFMFSYLDSQRSFSSQQCQFAYGISCFSASAYSNSVDTNVIFYLTNSGQYLLLQPGVNASVVQYGNFTGACTTGSTTTYNGALTAQAIEGQRITCNAFMPDALQTGAIITGTVAVNVIVCASGNPSNCQPAEYEIYLGNFSAQIIPRKYS